MRVLLLLAAGLLGACGPVPETLTLIEPEDRLLRGPGQSVRLEYVAHDAQGRRVAEPRLRWSSSSPEVATVEGGVVTARKTGRTTIEVSGGKARASVSFRVAIPGRLLLGAGEHGFIEVGRPERLSATVQDELGKRGTTSRSGGRSSSFGSEPSTAGEGPSRGCRSTGSPRTRRSSRSPPRGG